MTMALNHRARGLIGVRADATDAGKLLAEINKGFEQFKAAHAEELKGIQNKFADVVTTEKVERINAEIGKLQKALEDNARAMAALQVGGDGKAENKAVAEYKAAFEKWFRRGDRANVADLHDMAIKAALTTDANPDGGYIVTPTMETGIDRVLGTVSAIRNISRVVTTGGPSYKRIINLGGTSSGWVGERGARVETNTAQFSEMDFPTMEIYANPAATQGMLDDANVDIEQWIADEVATEFAEKEGAAFVSGSGVNQPRGFLSYDVVANASYSWGRIGFVVTGAAAGFVTPTTTVNPADAIIALYYSLREGYRNGGTFVLSDAVMGTVRAFKSGDGNYLWAPPTGVDMPATILGKPVVTDDNMPALGSNTFPIAFGNFQRGYLVVDRTGVRVLRDPYTNKPYVMFYTTKRVGGGVQNFEAIKLLRCSN